MGSSSRTSGSTALSRSLPTARGAAVVAGGDLLVIVGAMVAGELRHNISPVSRPMVVLDSLVPFLVGWVALSLLLGAYDEERLAAAVPSVRVGAGAWIGAANVGLILRQSPYFHGDITYPFPLVVTGTVLLGIVVWRALAPVLVDLGD